MKKILLLASIIGLSASPMAQGQSALKHHSYIELNGRGQYLSIPSSEDLNISSGESYTFTMWVWGEKAEAYSGGQYLMSKHLKGGSGDGQSGGYELMGYLNVASNFFGYNFVPSAQGGEPLKEWSKATGVRAELRRWYHIALVIDKAKGEVRTYMDGTETSRKALPQGSEFGLKNEVELRLGAGNNNGSPEKPFMGRLDNVRLYKRALNGKEIAKDRLSDRVSPKEKDLIAAFDFDDYLPGVKTISDVTGKHIATLHGYAQRHEGALVHTYETFQPNGNLIGRSSAQALGGFVLGVDKPVSLQSLEVDLEGTSNLEDIESLKLYMNESSDRFDPRKPGKLIASLRPTSQLVALSQALKGEPIDHKSKLWLVADVRPDAQEGNTISAKIAEVTVRQGKEQETFRPKAELMSQEIVLERTLLFTPGDYGSASYRIPAIVRLSDGTLVASIDRRNNSNYDLPEDISVQVIRSSDNGKTWSNPINVATGSPEYGYGDAAIVTDGETIHMVMVSGSGLWFYPSRAKKPIQMHYTKSIDGGKTWAPLRNITQEVNTDRYPYSGFFGSGNGIITSKGRIAFVAAMRVDDTWGGQMDNVMVYSDDQGGSWHSSPVARRNGDEAKIQELADGRLIISSRNRASGTPRTYVTSQDGGILWSYPKVWNELTGNACNAAFARYSWAKDGGENLLLHTLLESKERERLRLFLSDDEAQSWGVSREICRGEAAYSELVVLSDGTIGIISEENDHPAYDIYFTRVSLDWLKGGRETPRVVHHLPQ